MAQRVFQATTWAATGLANGGQGVNSQYQAIEGLATTTYFEVKEVSISGQASASTIVSTQLTRISTPATTPTALSAANGNTDGPMRGYSVAAVSVVSYVAASTGPVRASATTAGRLNLSINAFGGIYRWTAAPGEEWGSLGTSTNVQGALLSGNSLSGAVSAAGPIGSHIVYEWY